MAPIKESEGLPTETSRLVGGPSDKGRPRTPTDRVTICKWVFCAALGWGAIGCFVVLIGSELFTQSKWGVASYNINYLPYFDDLQPPNLPNNTSVSAAFIGNGMQFYNDLPRLMETMSEGNVSQNSCYRFGSTLKSIPIHGNGMATYWNTSSAIIDGASVDGLAIHDFGACTVKQLLFGKDRHLEKLAFKSKDGSHSGNPCVDFPEYMDYLDNYYSKTENRPKWDFIVLSDNTHNPFHPIGRGRGISSLKAHWISWIRKSRAIPVFLDTQGYYDSTNATVDVPTFTSITYEGYTEYAALVESYLPLSQKPRIAPLGIVYQLIWEEDYSLWLKLFHGDQAHNHNSPLGTFVQGCVIHYTLLGRMPEKKAVLKDDMSELWKYARMMQPLSDPPVDPFPNKADAEYAYNIAERVLVNKQLPKSFFIRQKNV
jgi:hypothetical protein